MSLQINLDQPPFSFLAEKELAWLKSRLDLVFFPAGEVILEVGQESPGIYILYKGVVEETDDDDQVFILESRGKYPERKSWSSEIIEIAQVADLDQDGRMEIISSNPTVILDIAHNPAAIKEVSQSIQKLFSS